MFGYKDHSNITFYYNSDELFNDVSLISAYMTKNLMGSTGSMLDEFGITDDEKDVFKVCVKQALPNIYEAMLKITSGVGNAFSAEVESDGSDGLDRADGTYIEITIQNNSVFNGNVLSLVDATLSDCLKYGVLTEFYSINPNADLRRLAQDKYASSLILLNQRLFQLKRKSISYSLDY